MLKGVDKGADGKDKPFIFLKRNLLKKAIVESVKKKET